MAENAVALHLNKVSFVLINCLFSFFRILTDTQFQSFATVSAILRLSIFFFVSDQVVDTVFDFRGGVIIFSFLYCFGTSFFIFPLFIPSSFYVFMLSYAFFFILFYVFLFYALTSVMDP